MQQILTDMKNIRQIITYLQVISLLALVATMAFRTSVFTRWIMITAGVFFILEFIVNKRWQTWHWTRDKWLYVAMIALYLYAFIWHIGSETNTSRFSIAIRDRLPLILCGIVGLLGLNKMIKLHHVAYIFLFTAVLSSIYIVSQTAGLSFFTLPWEQKTAMFAYYRITLVNQHMQYNLYLNFSLIFAFYLLCRQQTTIIIRILTIIATLWIFFILCLTDGRVGLASCVLLTVLICVITVYRFGKWKLLLPIFVVFAIIGGFAFSNNKRIDIEKIKKDPRVMLWQAGWLTVKDAPILGQGVCDARYAFIEKEHQIPNLLKWAQKDIKGKYKGDVQRVQVHNTYLEIWSEFGIIGLATLLFIFAFPLFLPPTQNRVFIALIIVICGIQCMFDTFFLSLIYGLSVMFFTSQSAISEEIVSQKRDKE